MAKPSQLHHAVGHDRASCDQRSKPLCSLLFARMMSHPLQRSSYKRGWRRSSAPSKPRSSTRREKKAAATEPVAVPSRIAPPAFLGRDAVRRSAFQNARLRGSAMSGLTSRSSSQKFAAAG